MGRATSWTDGTVEIDAAFINLGSYFLLNGFTSVYMNLVLMCKPTIQPKSEIISTIKFAIATCACS